MTDPRIFDLPPRAAFAERLEHDLLRVLGDAAAPTAIRSDTNEESIMTIEFDDHPTHRRQGAWKLFALAAAAVALIVALAAILTRPDDDESPADGTPVTFVVRWAYSDVRTTCDSTSGACLNHFDIPAAASFTGDVDGNGFQAVYWNDPADYPDLAVDHLEHIATYHVKGTVKGCGSGDFMLVELMQFVSGNDRDRDTGTYKGTWQIVDGSGRDGVRTVAGSGTSNGVFGTAGDDGRTFTGTIACPSS